MNDNNYIIKGGEEGKKRLEVLASILNAPTRQLLEKDTSLTGKNFLDVGCGGGSVSLMVAPLVGSGGSVTGIDFDQKIISLAQKDAVDKKMDNVLFKALDVYDIDYVDQFDIAYARFLLSHLTKPESVLQKMLASLKKGGKIVIEDIDFSGHYCFPQSKAFDTYVALFTKAAIHNKQQPNIGLSLFQLLKDAGLEDVQFDVIQPSHNTGAGKWMAYLTLDRIGETLLEQNLLTKPDLEATLEEIKAFTEDENTLISLPRIFRAWGIKK